jgi:hypothetical protein
MAKKTAAKKAPAKMEELLRLTGPDKLPKGAVIARERAILYAYRYTTGPFLLPENAHSLDWSVLNNDLKPQKVRVTVYRCPVGAQKYAVPPGPLEVTINPGWCTHNANSYTVGFAYEVQVECNSKLIFPEVTAWPGSMGYVIPGTAIRSADFIQTLP